MSLEIKNLVINVHVSGSAEDKVFSRIENLRSEILDECKELISESEDLMRDL